MPKDFVEKTPRFIALVLLGAFVISIFILFTVNLFIKKLDISSYTELRNGWFDLLRNAMVLLSTTLTTIIGYYFGQKAGADKEEKAERAINDFDVSVQKSLLNTVEDFKNIAKISGAIGNDPIEINSAPQNESDLDIQIP